MVPSRRSDASQRGLLTAEERRSEDRPSWHVRPCLPYPWGGWRTAHSGRWAILWRALASVLGLVHVPSMPLLPCLNVGAQRLILDPEGCNLPGQVVDLRFSRRGMLKRRRTHGWAPSWAAPARTAG